MKRRRVIARAKFDIAGERQMKFTLFEPRFDSAKRAWGCGLRFDHPLSTEKVIFGENSLQALVLALKVASTLLYGSDLYKEGKIGVFGEKGGPLILPAPNELIGIAPFPF